MRLFFSILFLLFLLPSNVNADTGADRCQTIDCLCLVRPGPKPDFSYSRINQNRIHSVFFLEGSHEVSSSQIARVSQFLENQNQISPEVTITGYTDGCGGWQYNRELAGRRIDEIRSAISQELPSARISTIVHGEATNSHRSDARRVDIIFHTNVERVTRIERIPADVYLIDGSGSMWGEWGGWTDIVNVSFRPGSRVYLSMMSGCRNGQVINSISPTGGTEIWYSYWRVLDFMSPGETLLIVSDFDSNIPITQRERSVISQKVRQRQINVITVTR